MTDDRYLPTLKVAGKEEKLVPHSNLQSELRLVWEAIHALEGRSGPISLRDSVSVTGDLVVTGDISGAGLVGSDNLSLSARAFDSTGSLSPVVGTTTNGTIYFDQVYDRLKVSENFRAFQDLVMYESVRVYNSIDQSITNNTLTTITFDTVRFDTASFFALSNPSRLTFATAGTYLIGVNVSFAANATGVRDVEILLNGATVIGSERASAASAGGTRIAVPTIWRISAGDYVETQVLQTSGGLLNVTMASAYSPEFWAARLM